MGTYRPRQRESIPPYSCPGRLPQRPIARAGLVLCRNSEIVATRSRKRSPSPAICFKRVPSARRQNDIMIKDFNVSEKGHGSYWLLGILRWVMVLIFVSFGIQKFTPQSADGIALYISNSPFVSWLSIFGIRGEAYLLGIIELTAAGLLAAGAFIPILSALGSLMGLGTFAITWSFFFSTPGVVKWSVSTDPIAGTLPGNSCTKMSSFFVFVSCCFWHHCQRKSSRFGDDAHRRW